MNISKILPGENPPEEINAIIEIPGSNNAGCPVKYEIDTQTGAITVDRILSTPMFFPCNYGFVPNTLHTDGDALDILVKTDVTLVPGAVIRCRPVAALKMEGEKGADHKIVAVPVDYVDPFQAHIRNLEHISQIEKDRIQHFFENYKDLEEGRWAKVHEWADINEAKEIIMRAIQEVRYQPFQNPDEAPDLSRGEWPQKFAAVPVTRGA